MRNPEFESIPHYASPTYRVNQHPSSNRDDHRPREPLIYHSMSTNSSILIRENAHIESFVKNDFAIRENRYQSEKEPPRHHENLAHSYKNFNIIHDEAPAELSIKSPTAFHNSNIPNMHQSTKNQDQKLAFSDPNIGAILTESSRQLDKINKMLEEHRKKKVYENVGGSGSFVVTSENPVIPEVREEAYRSVRNRLTNSKENVRPKETVSQQNTNRMKTRGAPLTNEHNNPLNLTHRSPKNMPTQKDMVSSYRATNLGYAGKKKSNENLHSITQKPPLDLPLPRQASSGRLSGNKSNQNLIENNKVLTPQSSSSKLDFHNYFNSKVGSFVEVSSPKGTIPTEKTKSKSLTKAKSPRSTRDKKASSEPKENPLKGGVPKISKNSHLILKNSKRAKEDEELKHKLTYSKHGSNEKDYSKYQEVAVNQFKILKENSARKEPHAHGESTPQFSSKDQEYYNSLGITGHYMSRNHPVPIPGQGGLSNENSRRSDNIKIVTGEDYMPSFEHNESIPSSCKSHVNFGEESRIRTSNHPSSTLDTESGLTDSCVEQLMNKRFSYSTRARPNKSPFQNESPSLEIKTSITPPTRLGVSKSPQARASPGISPANSIKIYNKILSNPLYRSVEPVKEPPQQNQNPDDNKIEIIQQNLRRLQQEYLILAGGQGQQKESEKSNDYGIETRHNIYANPQAASSQERISQNKSSMSRPLNDSERLSSYTNVSSTKAQGGASQESLMKSFKLRQNMLNEGSQSPSKERAPLIENINTEDYQLDPKLASNLYGSLSTQNKSSGEIAVYNRNSQWLSAKQNKIDALNTYRDREEMKECTFRPFMLTKSLRPQTMGYQPQIKNLRGEAISERARPASQLKSNLATIESPRYNDEEAWQQLEVSSKDKRGGSSYKQIQQARRNQSSFVSDSLSNSLHKASILSGSKKP